MARATGKGSSPALRTDFALGERTGYLLHKASMVIEADFEQALTALGLKARDFFVLAALAGGSPLSQQDLSRLLGLDPTTVVAVIDALEAKKYLERQRNPADRRRYILTLTAAGRRILTKADRLATDTEDAFLGQLSPTEQRQLQSLLSRVMSSRWPAAVTN